jgi:hypothetical protein
MESVYHIVTIRMNETSWAHVWRLCSLYLRTGYDTQDASNIQFSILISPVVGMHWNEMSRLSEPINDHPDGIKLAGRERQTHNEIHNDVFPLLGRNIQRLQQSDMSHMISLDSSTCIAFCNIASSLTLHSSPPELRFQIMIHLCTARVDRIFASMSFIKYLLA